jgi:hypothetical protein
MIILSNNRWRILKIVAAALITLVNVPTAHPQQECAAPPTSPASFEDDWIKVTAPDGWSSCQPVDRHSARQPMAGTLFKKGDFELYLITHTGHASPVEGGRFVEIAPLLSPWLDLSDAPDCGLHTQGQITKLSRRLSRVDVYFDAIHADANALQACGNPETRKVFWFGSYFEENCPPRGRIPSTDECGGYFIGHPRIAGKSGPSISQGMMTYTLTFHTNDPDYLPSRGDSELNEILKEATSIVLHIHYK